jgi:hypothetical protein
VAFIENKIIKIYEHDKAIKMLPKNILAGDKFNIPNPRIENNDNKVILSI